jgi:hypothetical protein
VTVSTLVLLIFLEDQKKPATGLHLTFKHVLNYVFSVTDYSSVSAVELWSVLLMCSGQLYKKTLCWWFVQQCIEPLFLFSVLFTDEAGFGRESIINFTTTTCGQKTILMVHSSINTSNCSALMSGQVLLIVW